MKYVDLTPVFQQKLTNAALYGVDVCAATLYAFIDGITALH
jgi:hypothetical protein